MSGVSQTERIQNLLLEQGLTPRDPAAWAAVRSETTATEEELAEFFGHGPLSELLKDDTVTEILVAGPDRIWAERGGSLCPFPGRFSDEEALRRYTRRLLATHGRKVDQRAPFADAALEGGIRLHVAIPPVSRGGICLSFRKPPKQPWTLARLEREGAFPPVVTSLLRSFLVERRNIFVCGGTGAGKTSLLSALVAEASPFERVIALEDICELRADHPHFLSLEARPSNQEGEGELPLGRLLREALRMRPDRLVIGECRGAEALDLLMALHTGHRGSLGTIHANSARDALYRLETLALLAAGNLREGAVKVLVASGVNVVVFLEREKGARRVSCIAEVKGVENGSYLLRETRP